RALGALRTADRRPRDRPRRHLTAGTGHHDRPEQRHRDKGRAMSTVKMSTVKQWITSRQHAFERRTAPHVDPAWSRALLLELRLRGAGGAEIGAVLAEVASPCAESGESAAEAFGPAVDYARTLDLPGDQG